MKCMQCLTIILLVSSNLGLAEEANLVTSSPVAITGYLETYYTKSSHQPKDNLMPGFAYSHNVTNKPSVNLALIKASLNFENVRANLALGSGTYMRANYASEPNTLQKIFEANVGLRLDDNLWLDVGVLPSHIGFESAIGIDNWTLTRSLLADNSPYFETGARLSYISEDGKWHASGLVLNGWQRIQRADNNTTPSFGHQLTFKPNNQLIFNSSSFVGNDQSDQDRKMRYFHNFYMQYQPNDRIGLIAAFDIGAEQAERNKRQYNTWYSPVLIARYRHSEQLSFATRAEYYQDRGEVIIESNQPNGFASQSYSINVDYKLTKLIVVRAELRKFYAKEKIFQHKNRFSDSNLNAISALIFQF